MCVLHMFALRQRFKSSCQSRKADDPVRTTYTQKVLGQPQFSSQTVIYYLSCLAVKRLLPEPN